MQISPVDKFTPSNEAASPNHSRSRLSSLWRALALRRLGAPLAMWVDDEPDSIDVAVNTLDEPSLVPPQFHIWTESAAEWFAIDDKLPCFLRARPGHEPDQKAVRAG